jgi:Uma2 family endonuclease
VDYRREDWFAASDLNVYFDVKHPLWHKRPDWFLAVDVPHLYDGTELRRSYVIWQEGRSPHVVVEFLSPGTETSDLGRFDQAAPETALANGQEPIASTPPDKLTVYEKYLRVPHYLVYDRRSGQIRYFLLVGGEYQEQSVQASAPMVWLADLQIGLAVWEGEFEAISGRWLRWCNAAGQWLPTDTEREREARERAEQRAEALAQRLRELGVDPDEVSDR